MLNFPTGSIATTAFATGATFAVAAIVALCASFVLVTRLERLAGRLNLSEAGLGLLVALAADSPEITSAITASVRGEREIGAGVVLGSNVFNLAVLLGLSAIVAGRIAFHRRVVALEGIVGTWVALASVFAVSTGRAGTGLVLVLVAVVPYVAISAVPAGRLELFGFPKAVTRWLSAAIEEEEAELAAAIPAREKGASDALVAGSSLIVVVGASTVMEWSAERLGEHFGLSDLIVGGVLLAAVTSLPNAVGAVVLAARRRGAAVLSEAMNSNMLNVVIGLLLPAVFTGIARASGGDLVVVWFYAGMTGFGLSVAFVRRGLSRMGGLTILALYGVFLAVAATR